MRLVGPGILDFSHCSVHATSLYYRVLFKHVCELGWMSTVGRSGDRYQQALSGLAVIQGEVMDI